MKEPGLDDRYRDQKPPKAGEIRQKRADASRPIPEFSPNATVGRMRQETGKVGIEAIRRVAKNR